MQLPDWTRDWIFFADLGDLLLGASALLVVVLLIIWWRQQTDAWFRVVMVQLLSAVVFTISSYYLFVMPPHYVGCDPACTGWRGYPIRFTRIEFDGRSMIGPVDFALNLLFIWLIVLGATLIWRLLGIAFRWDERSTRERVLFIVAFSLLPWAVMPRIAPPPQPNVSDIDLRLAINARRQAEFTYGITGAWVQRLALEDIEPLSPEEELIFRNPDIPPRDKPARRVCLRGYTYFYLPWQRYRITLDSDGRTAQELVQLPLTGYCWR